jgi:hypothetical protein
MTPPPSRIHILLSPSNVDAQTVVEFLCDVLEDGFYMMYDDVQIECESPLHPHEKHHVVSLLYDKTWKLRIHYNNDSVHVLKDSKDWSHSQGTDLSDVIRGNITQCNRRLDLSCDFDQGGEHSKDLDAVVLFLRNTFDPCHVFDSVNNRFVPM